MLVRKSSETTSEAPRIIEDDDIVRTTTPLGGSGKPRVVRNPFVDGSNPSRPTILDLFHFVFGAEFPPTLSLYTAGRVLY